MIKYFICLVLSISVASAYPIRHKMLPNILQVGVILQMPFAQNINGHYSGIAVDIWDKIAAANGWSFTYVPITDNTDLELMQLTGKNKLDVIIGPVTVDSKRLEAVDFSRSFFISSVNIITKHHETKFLDIIKSFLSNTLLISLTILGISFIVFISVVRYIEKGRISEVFTQYFNAFTKGIWFHLFRNGMSVPKAFYARLVLTPTAIVTRVITILWMLLAAAVFATINASYIASMTLGLNNSESTVSSIRDLEAINVAGVKSQKNVEIAEENGIYIHKVASLDEAVKLLKNGEVDAVVCDVPVCIQYLRSHKFSGLELNPLIIQNEELAFAVRLNSPLKHAIDLGITSLQDNNGVTNICKRYIGVKEASRCSM